MEKKLEQLAIDMLQIKTRDEAMLFVKKNGKLITKLAKTNDNDDLVKRAFTHVCIIITPEDYDDICD